MEAEANKWDAAHRLCFAREADSLTSVGRALRGLDMKLHPSCPAPKSPAATPATGSNPTDLYPCPVPSRPIRDLTGLWMPRMNPKLGFFFSLCKNGLGLFKTSFLLFYFLSL